MRIATSSLYDQQIAAIDNLVAQQAQYGNMLSTGKQLNQPSDNPTQIAQDLGLHTAISEENQTSTNIQNATAEMTTVDGSLSSLTNILQSARSLAVQGATDALSPAQQRSLASQVDGLLQEAIGLANTQYGGTYVFAGTAAPSSPPVSGNGQPVSSVTFTGNFEAQQQRFTNGQSTKTSVTLQQAFNYGATDGSPDVFQTLVNLRDTLANGSIVDQSGAALNKAGTVV
ncbi:MAG: flagellin N-terminal helical domain-containing protein, partial [Vulcanimicrobiaceae bacterium]